MLCSAVEPFDLAGEFRDLAGESPGFAQESSRLAGEFRDLAGESPGFAQESSRLAGEFRDLAGESPGFAQESSRLAGESFGLTGESFDFVDRHQVWLPIEVGCKAEYEPAGLPRRCFEPSLLKFAGYRIPKLGVYAAIPSYQVGQATFSFTVIIIIFTINDEICTIVIIEVVTSIPGI
ncbi:hypothetical protein GE09DRAFT_1216822 [Coniochaeta sp. 2T2.1]|nr:hypothetical protein GE09DRAFT_1216822 [Coniochaeta sp. 2T2.1]